MYPKSTTGSKTLDRMQRSPHSITWASRHGARVRARACRRVARDLEVRVTEKIHPVQGRARAARRGDGRRAIAPRARPRWYRVQLRQPRPLGLAVVLRSERTATRRPAMTRAAERGSLQALALGAPNVRAAMGLGRPARGREFAHRLFGRQPLTGEVAEPDLAHAVLPRRLPPEQFHPRVRNTARLHGKRQRLLPLFVEQFFAGLHVFFHCRCNPRRLLRGLGGHLRRGRLLTLLAPRRAADRAHADGRGEGGGPSAQRPPTLSSALAAPY